MNLVPSQFNIRTQISRNLLSEHFGIEWNSSAVTTVTNGCDKAPGEAVGVLVPVVAFAPEPLEAQRRARKLGRSVECRKMLSAQTRAERTGENEGRRRSPSRDSPLDHVARPD
jgi:hypothetical protein